MKVLHLCPGADTGGQSARITAAFRKHAPGWEMRYMAVSQTYLKYPQETPWDVEKARELYRWADVVHHHNRLTLYGAFDEGQRKPTILHHHGSRLRENPAAMSREGASIGATQMVSTIDLLDDCPGSTWLPAPFDFDDLQERYGGRTRRYPPVRVAHAPTNRRVKSTGLILKAAERVSRRQQLVFDLIEDVPWKVCLSRKSLSHLFIDQLKLGYGNNAIEAWVFGIPVIAGLEEPADRERFLAELDGQIPFYEASETNIETAIEAMVASPELRAEWGAKGLAHAEKYHSDRAVVERLKGIYESAGKTKGAKHLKLFAPVRRRAA